MKKQKFNNDNLPLDNSLQYSRSQPGFLETKGVFVIITICVILILSTIFIRYPDKVVQKAFLSNQNSIKPIISNEEGVIANLLKKNYDTVKYGDEILRLQSYVNIKTIQSLQNILKTEIRSKILDNTLSLNDYHRLYPYLDILEGTELFQHYKLLLNHLIDYETEKENANYLNKISLNERNILNSKQQLSIEDSKVVENQKGNNAIEDEYLYANKLITKDQYLSYQNQNTTNKIAITASKEKILNNKLSNLSIDNKIAEINNAKNQIYTKLLFSLAEMNNSLTTWVKSHTIYAQQDGIIEFPPLLQQGDRIMKNQNLGYIIPNKSDFLLRCYFQQNSLSKIQEKMPVEVRLDAYPYKKFGILEGSIVNISNVVSDSGALSSINIKQGLITNVGMRLQYRENLKAEIIVITEDRSILQRMVTTLTKGNDDK